MKRYETERQQLEQLLAFLVRRTGKVEGDLLQQGGALERDLDQQAIDLENEEVLLGLQGEGSEQIAQVSAALARLAGGVYGTCAECSGEIPRARLSALPYATACRPCAERVEAERAAAI